MATKSTSNALGYNVGVLKNDNFQEGQLGFVFFPGIGERVSQTKGAAPVEGSPNAASVALSWIISMGKIDVAADLHKFNVVAVPPRYNYEFGEHLMGARYSREVLKSNKVVALTNSLGQHGFSQQVSKNPEVAKAFDCLIGFVTGDGMSVNTAKHIAEAKLPCWLFTVENDTVSGTNPQATIKLHKAILAAGGVSWLTVFKSGQYSDKNSHQIISIVLPMLYNGKGVKIGDRGALTTDTPLGEKGIKNIITTSTMSVYEWAVLNSREISVAPDYQKPVSETSIPTAPPTVPTTPTKPPEGSEQELPPVNPDPVIIEQTIPPIVTPTTPEENVIISSWEMSGNTVDKYVQNCHLSIVWSDKTPQAFTGVKGDRLIGIGPGKDRLGRILQPPVFVLNYEKSGKKIVGPYKPKDIS